LLLLLPAFNLLSNCIPFLYFYSTKNFIKFYVLLAALSQLYLNLKNFFRCFYFLTFVYLLFSYKLKIYYEQKYFSHFFFLFRVFYEVLFIKINAWNFSVYYKHHVL